LCMFVFPSKPPRINLGAKRKPWVEPRVYY
jgi:hypothetical protein